MSIGAAGNDGADKVLIVPVVLHEVGGEPIEKARVDGDFALHAEVFGAFDEADTEEFLPESIDGDAGGEWIFGRDDPLGEIESIGVLFFAERGKEGGSVGFDFLAALVVGSDGKDIGFPFFLLIRHDHDLGESIAEVVELLLCGGFLLLQFGELGIAVSVAVIDEFMLGFGAAFGRRSQGVDETLILGESRSGLACSLDAEMPEVVVRVF